MLQRVARYVWELIEFAEPDSGLFAEVTGKHSSNEHSIGPTRCSQDLRHDVMMLVLLVADVHPGEVGGH